MNFLFYNKDILFEISKYLSCPDIKNLKFAFNNLDLEKIYLEKEQRSVIGLKFYDLYRLLNHIFRSEANQYLLYNRRYDSSTLTLTCDIDYQAVSRICRLVQREYQPYVSAHLINVIPPIIIKLNNGDQLYKYYHDHTESLFTNVEHLDYLIESNKLKNYIIEAEKNKLDELLDLNTYIDIGEKYHYLIIDSDQILLIWDLLKIENKKIIYDRLKAFMLINHNCNVEEFNQWIMLNDNLN